MFDSATATLRVSRKRSWARRSRAQGQGPHIQQGDVRDRARTHEVGSSRYHLMRAVEGSLRRLKTDHIGPLPAPRVRRDDPPEETLRTLDDLVRSWQGPVRGLLELLGLAPHEVPGRLRQGWAGAVTWRTRPTTRSWVETSSGSSCRSRSTQGVGTVVWSPLGWARLTGKIRRSTPLPAVSRLHVTKGPPSRMSTSTVSWMRSTQSRARREERAPDRHQLAPPEPTVSHGHHRPRNEEQLRDNLGSRRLEPDGEQISRLERRATGPAVPVLAPAGFERNPFPTLRWRGAGCVKSGAASPRDPGPARSPGPKQCVVRREPAILGTPTPGDMPSLFQRTPGGTADEALEPGHRGPWQREKCCP